MQTELLRELLDEALNDPDEKNRVSNFWVYALPYDDCIAMFRKIFNNKDLQSLSSDECKVTRIKEGFFIEDRHGGKDTYSLKEMGFLIDLWEKSLLNDLTANKYTFFDESENTQE